MAISSLNQHRIVIIGGGPGGYEAARAARQLGAEVILIEDSGIGGNAVLTDVVPSKTLIATADAAQQVAQAVGVTDDGVEGLEQGLALGDEGQQGLDVLQGGAGLLDEAQRALLEAGGQWRVFELVLDRVQRRDGFLSSTIGKKIHFTLK